MLELVFYQRLSLSEVAEVCGCPVGTVKSRLNYAKASLRGALSRAGWDAEEWRSMNEHNRISDLLPLYVSGALADDQRQAVEQHLPGCAACRADLALWRAMASNTWRWASGFPAGKA